VGNNEVNAVVRGRAPCEDLAVLELRPKPGGLKQAELGRASTVRAGDKVTALGFPGAFEEETTERRLQATDGTVSSGATSASIGDTLPKFPALIQHQAPISPGNSGGPLFNDRGEVVGVNTLAATAESGRQNQNGAISIDRARSLLKDLTANRSSGYVGWNVVPIKTDRGSKFLFVTGVDPNSPAERSNLTFGDAVFEIDDTEVGSVSEACDIIGSKSSGDRLKITGLNVPSRKFFIVRTRLR
jgi:S1-C subfamily serine protease